ncbi:MULTISPECIES: YfcL family protein [unclassified Pseudoalteromonas]|uniref:YfcL family protein n=1 Tax=unclassified Pseudoalteromonas TaxID=194690 RepID=UPI000F64AC0E|nr:MULTISPECIES: YfcL family protein [unclassified Pseudoalteromonas]RRS08220.1 YfcL family protein [Pseudoalteromonas sp. J010]RXE99052.1 YfcL family protein [Pseudoalteromonas sp. PS5]
MLLVEYVEKAQQFFDDLVDRASDDELFAGGYLRGHFDLAVGYAQVEEADLTVEELNAQVESSLVKAYRNGELNDDDKAHVVTIWEQVQNLK